MFPSNAMRPTQGPRHPRGLWTAAGLLAFGALLALPPKVYGHQPLYGANKDGTVGMPLAYSFYDAIYEYHGVLDRVPRSLVDVIHGWFTNVDVRSGGELGGRIVTADSWAAIDIAGQPPFEGFHHTLRVPIHCEAHEAPRTPFAAEQSFETNMVKLEGGIGPEDGDPVFESFTIHAGRHLDPALDSPGVTTLLSTCGDAACGAPGDPCCPFEVDSWFDVTYQISYVLRGDKRLGLEPETFVGTVRMKAFGPSKGIPTVSQWGVTIMALLLLTGGKIYFDRRRSRGNDRILAKTC